MIEDEKYFMGRDILNQCYSYNQLHYFYREFGLKGVDRYINELQNESKSKSREMERLNKELQNLEKLNNANYQSFIEVNNIINELEKWLEDMSNRTTLHISTITGFTMCLNKLQELKGSDEE